MTLARLLRCQPWGTSGIDNVPLTRPPGARWYLPWRFGRWRVLGAADLRARHHRRQDQDDGHDQRKHVGPKIPAQGM